MTEHKVQIIQPTTDLIKLRKGDPFTWGQVIAISTIGVYTIVEYHPWKAVGIKVLPQIDYESIYFHPYIQYRDLSYSCDDLDSALAHAIAVRNDGINTRADVYFIRGIKVSNPKHG